MGARGPAPTPTELLSLRGSRRAAGRKGELRPPACAPSCPGWLVPEAKREWRRAVKQLLALGILAEIDRALLAAYCEAWAEFAAVSADLEKTSRLVETDKGNVIQSPLVGIRNRAAERLLRLAAQFGMSPAARTRINAPTEDEPAEEEDPFEALLNGAAAAN